MQLIRSRSRDGAVVRSLYGELIDLGSRLEHLLSRYERLVRDAQSANAASAPDMQARVRMANRELSLVAVQLQQLLVEKRDGAESDEGPFGVIRSASA